MPDIIRLLPDRVANQIAAGEVVQRPASVVKELLENAMDAGASSVELIIKDGGRTLIQVIDDGCGMSENDARLAFERHATSKIRTTEDIFKITTKGFRGEALASICAVSEVEVKTRQAEQEVGSWILLNGGEIESQQVVQCPKGSSFAVKNLFYNVPARRRFLKSDSVELRHIMDEFHRVALAQWQTEFSFYNNEVEVFKLRKTSSLQRIFDIFGRKLQSFLIPIKEDTGWLKVHGYVGKPESAKKNRGEQFLFVNERYFRSPYFSRAIQEAFEGLLLPQYIPSYFLFFEINPEKIDVNIHPQKTEVKFEEESVIFALLKSCVKKSLGIYNIAPSLDFNKNPLSDQFIVSSSMNRTGSAPGIKVDKDYNPFLKSDAQSSSVYREMLDMSTMQESGVPASPSKINLFKDEELLEDELMRLPSGYWLYNHNAKTYLMDLGRVHRLIICDRTKNNRNSSLNSQRLLFSHDIYINESERITCRALWERLLALGFELDLDESKNLLSVHAIPLDISERDIAPLFEQILNDFDHNTDNNFTEFYKKKTIKVKTKSRFDFTCKQEAEEVIKEFVGLGFPQYGDNGKKCYVELPLEGIESEMK